MNQRPPGYENEKRNHISLANKGKTACSSHFLPTICRRVLKNKLSAAKKQGQKHGKKEEFPQSEKQRLGKYTTKITTQSTSKELPQTNFRIFRKKILEIEKHKKCPKTEGCPRNNWVKKNCHLHQPLRKRKINNFA